MKKKILLTLIVLIVSCIGVTSPGFSSLLTYQDLINQNKIIIDDKIFYDFSYTSSAFGGANPISANDVMVELIETPFNPGFRFIANWSASSGQGLDSLIRYSVRVLDGGNPIKDITLKMEDYYSSGNGGVAIAETTSLGTESLFVYSYSGGTKDFDQLFFNPTNGPITIVKDIVVIGVDGEASVLKVINQFSEVPVPPALFLLGPGLLGLFALKRKLMN